MVNRLVVGALSRHTLSNMTAIKNVAIKHRKIDADIV